MQRIFTPFHIGFASLLFISSTMSFAISLRDEAVGYRTQGYEAQKHGDADAALSFYQKACALDPTYAAPFNDAGVLLEEKGELEEAQKAYERALLINPNYLEAHANLAMLYEQMGQPSKAIYYWMKRYQLGSPKDLWTQRAEQRLVALGALRNIPMEQPVTPTHQMTPPAQKPITSSPVAPTHRKKQSAENAAVSDEFKAHAQSDEEFRSVTKQHGY